MSLFLGLDTTGPRSRVAVARGITLLAKSESEEGEQSECITDLIRKVCESAQIGLKDLSEIAVAVGPGSFTGIRTGISTAQGIASALKVKVHGTSILAARLLPHVKSPGLYLVSITGSRSERFVSIFNVDCDPKNAKPPIGAPSAWTVRELAPVIALPMEGFRELSQALLITVVSGTNDKGIVQRADSVIRVDLDTDAETSEGSAYLVALSAQLAALQLTENSGTVDRSRAANPDSEGHTAGSESRLLTPIYVKKVNAQTLEERRANQLTPRL